MKKLLGLLVLCSSIAFASATVFADDITININDNALVSDVAPQIINDRTMVPLRVIFEAVGANVNWDQETLTVTATKGSDVITMTIGSNVFYKNGEEIALDVPAQIVDGRTLVPVRAISESLGCTVNWLPDTKTVAISTADTNAEATTEATTETSTAGTSWIDSFMKSSSQPKAIEPSAYEEEIGITYHSDARYAFEQTNLPAYIEKNSAKLAKYITSSPDKFEEEVLSVWDTTSNTYATKYMMDAERTFTITMDTDTSDAETAAKEGLQKTVDEAKTYVHLTSEENLGFTYGKIDDNTYCMLLELADEDDLLLSSYIAIVYNKDYGFKYFTLENTLDETNTFEHPCMVCGVDGSTHINYSYRIERDKKLFLTCIDAVLNGDED